MRRPPRIVVELELERNHGHFWLVADTLEDEYRLRRWLRRSGALVELPALVERLLDSLDRIDEAAA